VLLALSLQAACFRRALMKFFSWFEIFTHAAPTLSFWCLNLVWRSVCAHIATKMGERYIFNIPKQPNIDSLPRLDVLYAEFFY